MEITRIRHRWTEKKGFLLNRPQGTGEYILLHFLFFMILLLKV